MGITLAIFSSLFIKVVSKRDNLALTNTLQNLKLNKTFLTATLRRRTLRIPPPPTPHSFQDVGNQSSSYYTLIHLFKAYFGLGALSVFTAAYISVSVHVISTSSFVYFHLLHSAPTLFSIISERLNFQYDVV